MSHEDANPAHLLGLSRACRERPYDRNSKNFDEISPAHGTLRKEVKGDQFSKLIRTWR